MLVSYITQIVIQVTNVGKLLIAVNELFVIKKA